MSKVSGACDLLDHILMEKMYDKPGYKVSDLLECFEIFKKKTNGIIYKNMLVSKVDEQNQDFIAECNPFFKVIKHEEDRPNKASKSGFRHFVWYTYTYFNKEYTKKELRKLGCLTIQVEIPFNTLLDLMPYLPYAVSMSYSDKEAEHIVISGRSIVDAEETTAINCGYLPKMTSFYREELAKLYLDVCRHYFLDSIDEREVVESIKIIDKERGIAETSYPIDYMHNMNFVFDGAENRPHWTSPKLLESNKYKISEEDMNYYLTEMLKEGTVKISYVKKADKKLFLE